MCQFMLLNRGTTLPPSFVVTPNLHFNPTTYPDSKREDKHGRDEKTESSTSVHHTTVHETGIRVVITTDGTDNGGLARLLHFVIHYNKG